MVTNKTRTALMAGAATLSLTVASLASEFSRVVVFGDRLMDSGQFVDDLTVFRDDPTEPITTDGRGRFTNRDTDGNTGHPWSTLVSRNLGHGDTNPSQPQRLDDSPPVTEGDNYASGFFNSSQIRQSVDGHSFMGGIIYESGGVQRIVPGTDTPGFLADPEKTGWAANSIVLMNGGGRDVREVFELTRGFDGSVALNSVPDNTNTALRYVGDAAVRDIIAENAADNITSGALLMRDAGAGLVVVSNLMDQGDMPEVARSIDGANSGLAALRGIYGPDLDAAVMTADHSRAYDVFQRIVADPEIVRRTRSESTDVFNARMSANLDGQNNVIVLDQNALVAEMIANPGRFGLSADGSQADDCLTDTGLHPCTEVDTFVNDQIFLDGIDITTTAHTMMAEHAVAVIDAPVIVSGTPLMAMQSGRAVANAGTGQVAPERLRQRGWAPFVSGGIGQSTWNSLEGEGRSASQPLSAVGGVTYSLGNGVAVGVAGGYQEIMDPSSEHGIAYTGDAMYGTVFAGADFGRVFGNASATVGTVNYDSLDRRSNIGAATVVNSGSTEADVFGASIEMGVRALTHGTIAAGPIASLDHWSADVAAYSENGWSATAVSYDGFDASSTRASLGLFLEAGDLQDADMPAVFRVKALYTRELETDGVDVSARAASSPNNTFTREGRGAVADSITVGAQLSYDFGPLIGSIGYDARIGENDDHYGRIDISLPINGGV